VVNASERETHSIIKQRVGCVACKLRDLCFSESFINKRSADVDRPETKMEPQKTEKHKVA